MGRSSDHVFQFMMAELGTEGSIDGNKRLVIRGKFVPKVSSCFIFIIVVICIVYVLIINTLCFFHTNTPPLPTSTSVHRISAAQVHRRVRGLPDVPQLQDQPHPRQRLQTLLRGLPGTYTDMVVVVIMYSI